MCRRIPNNFCRYFTLKGVTRIPVLAVASLQKYRMEMGRRKNILIMEKADKHYLSQVISANTHCRKPHPQYALSI